MSTAEHQELQQKFDKKERECDAKTQEKDEMMQTLNKMKEKLEKETFEHRNVKQQVADLSARLHELSTVRPPLHFRTSQKPSNTTCCSLGGGCANNSSHMQLIMSPNYYSDQIKGPSLYIYFYNYTH